MPSPAPLAVLALCARLAAAEITCIDGGDFQRSSSRGGRAAADQKLGAWKESAGHAHLLCESGLQGGAAVRTTTEMLRGKIGSKTGWQSANPYGRIQLEISRINGARVSAGSVAIIPGYEQYKICGAGDGGNVWQFSDAMGVVNTLGGGTGAQIMAYSFRSDAVKEEVLSGQRLFSIDASMLNCKLEVVVKMPVPASGDLTFAVQLYVERDGDEEALNAALTLTHTATELLVMTDRDTADGVRNATTGSSIIMSMAKGLVCGSSESAVDSSAISISNPGFPEDNVFEYTVKRGSILGCEFLYWDPLLRPLGMDAGSARGTGPPASGSLAVLLSAALLMTGTLWSP